MKYEYATNLAFFLLERTGSVCGLWKGKLTAKQQRDLFGKFLGKGTICINGATERLTHTIKVCFGTDFDVNANLKWSEL